MVKSRQNLELFGPDFVQWLSILESRKTNWLSLNRSAEDYNLDLLQNGLTSAEKLVTFTRGLRKSSSLTNGISRARNKAPLKEYGTEARGLRLSTNSVNASILGTPVNGSL